MKRRRKSHLFRLSRRDKQLFKGNATGLATGLAMGVAFSNPLDGLIIGGGYCLAKTTNEAIEYVHNRNVRKKKRLLRLRRLRKSRRSRK